MDLHVSECTDPDCNSNSTHRFSYFESLSILPTLSWDRETLTFFFSYFMSTDYISPIKSEKRGVKTYSLTFPGKMHINIFQRFLNWSYDTWHVAFSITHARLTSKGKHVFQSTRISHATLLYVCPYFHFIHSLFKDLSFPIKNTEPIKWRPKYYSVQKHRFKLITTNKYPTTFTRR